MEAHLCTGGYSGHYKCRRVRPYCSLLCSICTGKGAVELEMSREEIDEYNKKLMEESERDGKEKE